MRRATGQTLIVLGAARSGTKLVRDLIAAHPQVASVPHDVNFIWSAGLRDQGHDELTAAQATPAIAHKIRRRLDRQRKGSQWLVEKTVSNTLRVPFIDAVLPEAHYLHLVRDGRDVVLSSTEQWDAPTDWKRLLGKLRLVPPTELPSYAFDYLRTSRGSSGPSAWGVRPKGLADWVRDLPLLDVNARQWVASVEATLSALADVAPTRQHTVRYEDLVQQPVETISGILGFMKLDATSELTAAAAGVRKDLVGSRLDRLSAEDRARLESIIGPTLTRLGYEEHPAESA